MKTMYLSEKDVPQRWAEIKTEEMLWAEVDRQTLQLVKRTLSLTVEHEFNTFIQAAPYARRTGQPLRNGHYTRTLVTRWGILTALPVPRARTKGFQSQVLPRYGQRAAQVDPLIQSLFLKGVSTRQVGEVLDALLGYQPASSTVSQVTAKLADATRAFHQRPLPDHYQYLICDGVWLTVFGKRYVALTAVGITVTGQVELVDFFLATRESAATWTRFLNDLDRRGLHGQALQLLTKDGHQGLDAAVEQVYPTVPVQLCWVHKLRNVATYLPKRLYATCLAELKRVYQAPDRRTAARRLTAWAARWQAAAPKAVRSVTRHQEALLAHFACPVAHRIKIRTTNIIERAFREVRRRTQPMNQFITLASCDRLTFAILSALNGRWARRHALPGFKPLAVPLALAA
jgi:putative transposase